MRLLMVSHHGWPQRAPSLALLQESGTQRIFVTALHQNQSSGSAPAIPDPVAPEGAPLDLSGFAAHALRDRFPPDIEKQIEQAWD